MPFRFRTLVRPLSLLTAAALALVTPVALTGPTSAAPRPHPVASGRHVVGLSPMTSSAARSTGAGGGAESQVVETPGGLRVIGLSWPRGSIAATDRIEVRERTGAHWGPWEEMHADDADGPDPGTRPAGTTREGTEPWITTADAVQVRVLGPASAAAARASLDVIDPRHSVADVAPDSGAGAAVAAGVRPTIYSRAQWGADESIRTWAPSYGTIRAAVVHHTAGSNTYTAADVPAIIRGIYVFHTLGRDWGDIGYNFLIDKFGRIWEGRYGGVDKPTIGGHAAPFNSQTYGASVLGDFTSVTPPAAVVTAQARLAAWKLGLTHINPTGTTVLDGKGTTPTIVGHRDLNQTSCPGTYLYGRLGAIRSQARSYQGTMVYYPAISAGSVAYGGGGVTVTGRPTTGVTWRLTVSSVCRPDVTWSTSGTASSSAPIAATWPGTLPGGSPARPGDYRVVLTATSGSSTAATDSVEYTVTVRSAAGAPASFCPPRLEGGNRYETAVAVSRAQDPNARTVVLASGEQRAMADALVAAPLARARQGVLLLTQGGSLPAATRAEIVRRGATTVLLVGGTGVIADAVATELKGLGVATVTRVWGQSRFDTAAAVAAAMGTSHPSVLLANGDDASLVDGLVLSGPGAALGRPILFVTATGVPAATDLELAAAGTRSTLVAGGDVVVPDAVLADLPQAVRAGGSNRFATAAAVASWARTQMSVTDVVLASGDSSSLVDMLSGGQLGRVALTVHRNVMPSETAAWLDGSPDLEGVVVLGGSGAVALPVGGRAQKAVLG